METVFVCVEKNGKIYNGIVESVKMVKGRELVTIGWVDHNGDEKYRSFYRDSSIITQTNPERVD